MTWLAHPYQRFILLGALLYAGMAWLGYQTASKQEVYVGCEPLSENWQIGNVNAIPPTMTADTVSVVHYYKRAKAVRPLPKLIDRLTEPDREYPEVVGWVLPPPPLPPPPPRPKKPSFGCFTFSERMPIFPGCDETIPYEEHKACGEQKLLEFIYANIRYPVNAREESCIGTAVIEFVVQSNGRIEDAEIIADPGCGLGAIALAAVAEMNKQGILWIPGHQHGLPVAAKSSLPIRFKLE